MKRIALAVCLVILASAITARAQSNTAQPGPEYNVLNVWTGNWVVQGDTRATASGPTNKFEWTLKGQRILGGFFLQIQHVWKERGTVQKWLEVTGYDPAKKSIMTHCYFDDGSWLISTPTFTAERICIENGTTFSPDGTSVKWRDTWNFSSDWKSFSVKCEIDNGGTCWIYYEGKGVRGPNK